MPVYFGKDLFSLKLDKNIRRNILNIFNLVEKRFSPDRKRIVNLVFVNSEQMKRINFTYRKKDYPTDVLSFPADFENFPFHLGDLIICYDVAVLQSINYKHSLEREISFLFLHGLLHLLGYDHEEKADELVMFDLQKKILDELGIKRE